MPLTIIPDTDKPLPDTFEPEEPKTFKKKVKAFHYETNEN